MNLLPILKNLRDQSINQKEINFLVEKSYKISIQYLRIYQTKLSKILKQNDLTLNDIAIDAIAPLFQRDKNNVFFVIKKSFNNWTPPVLTEEDASYFFCKIITKNAEQHISKLLKNSDPFFAKILDSINYFLRKEQYCKINYLGHVYIVETDIDKIPANIIDNEQFEKLPASLFIEQKTLLNNLFNYLRKETNFYPAIPLNQLVQKIKNLKVSISHIEEYTSGIVKTLEINEKVNKGLKSAKELLISTYLNKNKLNKNETKNFEKALMDISQDLKDGGINPGLYSYLDRYFVDLSRDYYDKNYHNIMEYLIRVMKRTIADEFDK